MESHEGLITCGQDWGTSFCIVQPYKLTQKINISLHECNFYRNHHLRNDISYLQRKIIQFLCCCLLRNANFIVLQQVVNTVNLFHTVWHKAWILTHFQQLFINLYFITIVYQVATKLLRKYYRNNKRVKIVVHIIFAIFLIIMLVTFILAIFLKISDCEEIYYLIFDSVGIILSSILLGVGIKFNRNEMQKIKGIYNTQHVKNTLPYMWIWISINILGVLFSLLEALIFLINPQGGCKFTKNLILDDTLKLIFIFLTFHLGMLATIVFYRMKYQRFDRMQLEDSILQEAPTELQRANSIQMRDEKSLKFHIQSDLYSRRSID